MLEVVAVPDQFSRRDRGRGEPVPSKEDHLALAGRRHRSGAVAADRDRLETRGVGGDRFSAESDALRSGNRKGRCDRRILRADGEPAREHHCNCGGDGVHPRARGTITPPLDGFAQHVSASGEP